MAINKGAASGETLTRTLAANIIAGLRGDNRPCGDYGFNLLNGGHGRDPTGRGFGDNDLIGRVGNDLGDEVVAGRRGIRAVPLLSVFRPF